MGRETNNTGRTTRKNKKSKIDDVFIPYTMEMLQSPALAVLNVIDRKILDRFGIEHLAHAGNENGNLKCTFGDFVEFGIRRGSISDSIRRLQALGFIEIIKHGGMNRAEFKHPSIYRLTFVLGNSEPTNEWRKFKDINSAKNAASSASKYRNTEKKKNSTKTKSQ